MPTVVFPQSGINIIRVHARCVFALLTGLSLISCDSTVTSAPPNTFAEFEQRLETLRAAAHISAISVAIARDQSIVWTRSYGVADIAQQRSAEDTTVYHLASLTKPLASVVILQLVEEGLVALDDPVSKFGIDLPGTGIVRVRHLLSHTSEGVPGARFSYSGDRFGLLDSVITRVTGQSFAQALQNRVISRIGLRRTAPNPQSSAFQVSGFNRTAFEANMARGYTWAGGAQGPTQYPSYFGTAAGLTASATDYANFSMAMDRDALLSASTKTLAFTPVVTTAGGTSPYGLGWFATNYKGVNIVWHYGLWTANSSLIVKVPARGLTFVVLGNSDAISAPYQLGAGKLETSPWALAFLDAFVIGNVELPGTR